MTACVNVCGLSSPLTLCISHSGTFVWYFKLVRLFLPLASNLLDERKSLRGLFKHLKRKHSVWFSRMFIHFMRRKRIVSIEDIQYSLTRTCNYMNAFIMDVYYGFDHLHMEKCRFLTGIVAKIETFPSFEMFSDVLQ